MGSAATSSFIRSRAAIAASASGDTIQIQAGKYVDDYPPTITHNLTIVGVGGQVQMVATAAHPPPNQKGILVIGAMGATPNVTVENVTFRDTKISNNLGGNGAGIRYQGGNLTLIHDGFINNQDGLLAASDPSGSITVNGCVFRHNGSGTGQTHNVYVNDVGTLTLENSRFLDAVVGHEIKSRAENTIIRNNLIADGPTGTASYSIDLPNGGNAIIEHNRIEKGPDAQNPVIITTGEEGNIYPSSSLLVSDNTIVNDETAHIGDGGAQRHVRNRPDQRQPGLGTHAEPDLQRAGDGQRHRLPAHGAALGRTARRDGQRRDAFGRDPHCAARFHRRPGRRRAARPCRFGW